MKIIDAHIHFSKIKAFGDYAKNVSLADYSAEGYKKSADEFNVAASICMGLVETHPSAFPDKNPKTPMLFDLAENLPAGMKICAGINPHTLNARAVSELNELASAHKIAGFKIYAGYYYFYVYDEIYDPVYDIAMKFDLPVVIHAGETYSKRGLLEYAHPLHIDRLAVKYPDLKIIICHMGAPWVFDACETAGKNENVFLDLSGLLVGSAEYIKKMSEQKLLTDRYMTPLILMDNYEKVIYGSDWPLAPFGEYINFIKKLIPDYAREDVFYNNAAKLFGIH